MARLAGIVASIAASIASRAATVRQQSNIDFLNDINLGLLKDSALFNLNIAINSSDRLNHLLQLPSTPQKLSRGARVKRSGGFWVWEATMKTIGAAFGTALLLATAGAASAADFPAQPYYAAPPPWSPVGPAPISAPCSAMNGVRSATIRP